MPRGILKGFAATVAVVTAAALTSGCGIRIPNDPDGTLEDVTGGTLRVGVDIDSGEEPLITLVEQFAAEIDADLEWHEHGEERLVMMLERDQIDLAVGGFTGATPWSSRAGMTRPIAELPGVPEPKVLLVQLGENAFLSELEGFLDSEGLT